MMGPGFGAAVAGEYVRRILPWLVCLVAAVLLIGAGIGYLISGWLA